MQIRLDSASWGWAELGKNLANYVWNKVAALKKISSIVEQPCHILTYYALHMWQIEKGFTSSTGWSVWSAVWPVPSFTSWTQKTKNIFHEKKQDFGGKL